MGWELGGRHCFDLCARYSGGVEGRWCRERRRRRGGVADGLLVCWAGIWGLRLRLEL
jgi:hypothetical protein